MEVIKSLLASIRDHRQRSERPFVTLSYAQSLDGCISARAGESLALTGLESRALSHRIRANHDAIVVGIGTVLSDDPSLNVRLVKGKNPRPIVLDSRLRLPLTANLLKTTSDPPVVCTRENPDGERVKALTEAGALVITLASNSRGQVSLNAFLDKLGEMGIKSIMIQGGSRVITSFLLARLANYIVLTVVPVFVGGMRAVSELGQSDPQRFLRVQSPGHEWHGGDLVLWGRLS